MAEFVSKEDVGDIGDSIVFENKTDSSFEVSAGIVFHKSGLYEVSVCDNRTTVTKVGSASTAQEYKWHKFYKKQNHYTKLWEWAEPLPKDGQHILISIILNNNEYVRDDNWYEYTDMYLLGSGYEIGTEAVAWMPVPEPYHE